MPKRKVTYRVYQHTRVKHKIPFFNEEVYPVYTTVMYGKRALNFKSRVFDHLLHQPGYNLPARLANIESIMQQESMVTGFIVESLGDHFTAEEFKQQYAFYTTDLLQQLEHQVKQFLISFFNQEGIPSIAHLISHTSEHLAADIIMKDLEKSLSPLLLRKIRSDPFFKETPYLPLKRFYESVTIDMPVLMAFNFCQQSFCTALLFFLQKELPEFASYNFMQWIHSILSINNYTLSYKNKLLY